MGRGKEREGKKGKGKRRDRGNSGKAPNSHFWPVASILYILVGCSLHPVKNRGGVEGENQK